MVPKAAAVNANFPFNIKNLMFQPEEQNRSVEHEAKERANWVERLLELRSKWRRNREESNEVEDGDYYCGVGYDEEEEDPIKEEEWDPVMFRTYLSKVRWSEAKRFSKLAFLCNLAYVVEDIKAEDLRKYYGLRLITSSLEKKAAAALKAKLELDSTQTNGPSPTKPDPNPHPKQPMRSSAAYEIAASAASYVHSRAKGLLMLGGGTDDESDQDEHNEYCELAPSSGNETRCERTVYKSEVAAYMAASTMTAVVAAEEEARLEAARDLRTLHSSPCEWFVCDDPDTCTRGFVIQGSDSLASWQANLFFEPTKFEETEVLVHRGIYEAAKGLYDQFMPEIISHLNNYGSQAKLRFIGHSLGGSLSMLVNLMLLSRGSVPRSSLLPVVTFGSPSVFCSGHRVLEELGVDEDHICSIMMHRDIVPRAFSCNYPNHIAQLLKRINGSFRSHPCLNHQKVLYSPIGKLYILQPDEKSSPAHPLLPAGAALYTLNFKDENGTYIPGASSALKAFLNSPHPLETLSKPTAYGSEGTILRDHDSSNYLKAINGLIREHTKSFARKSMSLYHWWPRLTTTETKTLVPKQVATGVRV